MLSVEQLLPYYPLPQQKFREFILREYLQHKILQIVFNQPEHSGKLCFMGGTCLRILHDNQRFSEDLDFDNKGLSVENFGLLSLAIQKGLEREGYSVEMKTVYKGAYHCYVRFPGLLFQEGLTGHREHKILIQLDAEPQDYPFQPEMKIVNKFDVFSEIPVAPLTLLLAQKFYAILNRSRAKGRDFFDVVFILSKGVKPDYSYLNMKLGISAAGALREKLLNTCSLINMQAMADEVAPFLFNPDDSRKVLMFERYLAQVEL